MEQAITITDVNTEDIDVLWPHIEHHLESALSYGSGEYRLEDIYQGLVGGYMRLWIAYDQDGFLQASAVCQIRRFPNKRVCFIILSGGGSIDIWLNALGPIESWAQENGADAITAYTRKGVAKKMQEAGFTQLYTVVNKELSERRLH